MTQAEMEDRIDELENALWRIYNWSKAYPSDIFPEPDYRKAAEVLREKGMTLDAIAGNCMKHATMGVGNIARIALGIEQETTSRLPSKYPHTPREPQGSEATDHG